MNRRDLVKTVAAHGGLEPKQVDSMMKRMTEVMTAVVAKGEQVSIPGFAKFAKVERPARMGRNPGTGESIKIKASKKARITPLKGFKDAVMSPSQAPKLPKSVWPGTSAGAAKAAPASGPTAKTASKKASASKKAAPTKAAGAKRGATKAPSKKAAAKKR